MSDTTDLDAAHERESEALSELNELISKFNGDEYPNTPHIETSLVFYLAARMAASADGESGEEHFPRDAIIKITEAGIDTGKDLIEQGRKDGSLPRPFKLIKPGMH